MEIIADLHIHSRYSMATSKLGTPEYLDLWARKKGISLVGTGDFTHPAWREELKEKLVPAESGLYRLRDEYVLEPTFHRHSFPVKFPEDRDNQVPVLAFRLSEYFQSFRVSQLFYLLLQSRIKEVHYAPCGTFHSSYR